MLCKNLRAGNTVVKTWEHKHCGNNLGFVFCFFFFPLFPFYKLTFPLLQYVGTLNLFGLLIETRLCKWSVLINEQKSVTSPQPGFKQVIWGVRTCPTEHPAVGNSGGCSSWPLHLPSPSFEKTTISSYRCPQSCPPRSLLLHSCAADAVRTFLPQQHILTTTGESQLLWISTQVQTPCGITTVSRNPSHSILKTYDRMSKFTVLAPG